MKTIIVAAAAWAIGAALGYILAHRYITVLRRRVRTLRAIVNGGSKRKKMGAMDRVLIVEVLILLAYIVADMVVFWHTGAEPTTLTACVFSLGGLENGVMGWIKTNKDKINGGGDPPAQRPPDPEEREPPDVGI